MIGLPVFAEDVVELVVNGVELDGAERDRDEDPVVAIAARAWGEAPATGLLRLITSVRYCIHSSRTRWDLLQDAGPDGWKEHWQARPGNQIPMGPQGSGMGARALLCYQTAALHGIARF